MKGLWCRYRSRSLRTRLWSAGRAGRPLSVSDPCHCHCVRFLWKKKIGKAIKFNHFMGLLLGWIYGPIFDQGFCNLVMGGSGYSNPTFYYLMENLIIHGHFIGLNIGPYSTACLRQGFSKSIGGKKFQFDL